jgi:hypothetical protein
VRHGFSQFNYEHAKLVEAYGEDSDEVLAIKTDPKIVDLGLHSIGVEQADNASHIINTMNFKAVFVSPFKRTLETCIHLYRNHPNKNNIKFIILPIIKTSNVIGDDMHSIMKEYGPGTQMAQGINFDFSLMYVYGRLDMWYIYTLTNVPKF